MSRDNPMSAETSATHETEPLDPQEATYRALHGERASLERDLVLAQQQQQFGSNERQVADARKREGDLLQALDRVMTQIRAAEIRRQPGSPARRWQ